MPVTELTDLMRGSNADPPGNRKVMVRAACALNLPHVTTWNRWLPRTTEGLHPADRYLAGAAAQCSYSLFVLLQAGGLQQEKKSYGQRDPFPPGEGNVS